MNGLENKKQVAYFEYDYSKHGGAQGDISVAGNGIPKGAIITSGVIHTKTAVLSGGAATVAIKALSAADILAATAKASLSLNALLDVVPDGAATNMIRVTSNITALTFTVADADLTAGKIAVALEYVVTD
jgi:hypothetical protein